MADETTDVDGRTRSVRPGGAELVRRMAVEERPATAGTPTSGAATASADSVESLRRLVRDLKHDVRMLKVVVDKQSALLERLMVQLDRS